MQQQQQQLLCSERNVYIFPMTYEIVTSLRNRREFNSTFGSL